MKKCIRHFLPAVDFENIYSLRCVSGFAPLFQAELGAGD